ncbi:hypothetical protein N9E57_02110 [Gammaproteobacteria bacterium]|nr:hypothetical protein [Gammaproteobacteria bacterium]
MGRIYCRISLLLIFSMASFSVAAEKNFSGVWVGNYSEDFPDRLPGPELGDYAGLPINDADRLRAQSWSASLIALPEYQCRVHPSDYASSFANIRIWEEREPISEELIAIRVQHFAWQTRRTIWMDGREHPPEYAQHTSMGFSTGEWVGHQLKVKTTHLKEGWLRRNGVTRSDQATVTEYFIRHDDLLTWTVIIDDPVYLDEPFIRNRDYIYSIDNQIGNYPCDPVIEMVREPGYIPHHLPGTNTDMLIYSERHDIPLEGAMGGADTMYPEYMERLRELPRPSELAGGQE